MAYISIVGHARAKVITHIQKSQAVTHGNDNVTFALEATWQFVDILPMELEDLIIIKQPQ